MVTLFSGGVYYIGNVLAWPCFVVMACRMSSWCREKDGGKTWRKEIPIRAKFARLRRGYMRRPPIRAGLNLRIYQQGTWFSQVRFSICWS